MNEQERHLRIRLLREELLKRSSHSVFPQCWSCGCPHAVHKATLSGQLVCAIPGCPCIDYTLPHIPEQIELACDELFYSLRRFRYDRSPDALHKLTKATKLVEDLFFEPLLIRNGQAVQVCNKHKRWQHPRTRAVSCSLAFPKDEPLFAEVKNG